MIGAPGFGFGMLVVLNIKMTAGYGTGGLFGVLPKVVPVEAGTTTP